VGSRAHLTRLMSVREKDDPALFTKIQEHNLLRQYDLLSNCIEIGLQKGIRVSEEATRSRRGRRRYCHVAVSTLSGTQAPQTPHGPRSRRRRRNGARSASGAVSTTTKVMLRKCHCPCCAAASILLTFHLARWIAQEGPQAWILLTRAYSLRAAPHHHYQFPAARRRLADTLDRLDLLCPLTNQKPDARIEPNEGAPAYVHPPHARDCRVVASYSCASGAIDSSGS